MYDYEMLIKKDDSYFCNIQLKADNRTQAVEQSNYIMNKFDLDYTSTVYEVSKKGKKAFSWFNGNSCCAFDM